MRVAQGSPPDIARGVRVALAELQALRRPHPTRPARVPHCARAHHPCRRWRRTACSARHRCCSASARAWCCPQTSGRWAPRRRGPCARATSAPWRARPPPSAHSPPAVSSLLAQVEVDSSAVPYHVSAPNGQRWWYQAGALESAAGGAEAAGAAAGQHQHCGWTPSPGLELDGYLGSGHDLRCGMTRAEAERFCRENPYENAMGYTYQKGQPHSCWVKVIHPIMPSCRPVYCSCLSPHKASLCLALPDARDHFL